MYEIKITTQRKSVKISRSNVTGSGAVDSVNGQTGTVVVTVASIGASPLSHTHSATDVTGLATVATSGDYNDLTNKPTTSSAVTSVAGRTGAVVLAKADVGLTNVDNTSDASKPVSTATALELAGKANASHTHAQSDVTGLETALAGKANTSHTHTASQVIDLTTAVDARITNATGNTVASLVGGKVPTSQIPAQALSSVQTASSEAGMLVLTTQEGDVVVRTDEKKTYMRNAGTAGTMADYTLLDTPSDAVTSVNGHTGTVVLAKADIGLGNVENTSDANKPISTATQTALDNKADDAHTHTKADVTDFAHTHPVGEISATGTPSASTYLRGDGVWETPVSDSPVSSVNSYTGDVMLGVSDLADVDITGLADGNILQWSDTDVAWRPVTAPSGGGGGGVSEWTLVVDYPVTGAYRTEPNITLDTTTYTQFRIEYAFGNVGGSTHQLAARVNGDTTATNYFNTRLSYSMGDQQNNTLNYLSFGRSGGNYFSTGMVDIMVVGNYVHAKATYNAGAPGGGVREAMTFGAYENPSPVAITSIELAQYDYNSMLQLNVGSFIRVYAK